MSIDSCAARAAERDGGKRPLKVNFDAIPQELQTHRQWVTWRIEQRNGKPTKVPYSPTTDRKAESDNASTWGTFSEAVADYQAGRGDGIGFMFSPNDPYAGVDLDHSRNPQTGEVEQWALDAVRLLNSYTEVSPSGTGLHILVRGRLPEGRRKSGHVETYDAGRFFTVTGQRLDGTPWTVEDRQAELEAYHTAIFGKPSDGKAEMPGAKGTNSLSDLELISRASAASGNAGPKFAALWRGDTAGYASQSEADLALCSYLAFWTNGDAARIDSLFRQSRLWRPKWDERHGARTYGQATIEKVLSTFTEGYTGPAQRVHVSGPGHHGDEPADWEPPLPFFEPDLPPFPTDALPTWLRSYVEALSTALQVPADLPGMLGLAVLAAAVQKSVVVVPRPGWREQTSLYVVVALPSGTRKSATLAALAKPIEEYEAAQVRALAAEVAKAESDYQALKARVASLQAKAGKAEDPNEAESLKRQAAEAAVELASTAVPVLPRLLADDITPERLASLLALHGGKLAVFSPEGTLFDLMQARYGNAPNFDVFLKAHCGDTLRVDRIGRPAEFVPEPALTLGLAPQPDVLRGLAATPSLRGRGLLARLLYSWPPSPLGHREVEPPAVADDLAEVYAHGVRALLKLRPQVDSLGREVPTPLTLSPSAYQTFIGFCRWLEPQLAEDGELGSLSDWAGKLAGAVGRVSGLLHLAEYAPRGTAWGTVIDRGSVEHAIRIGHYLLAHARATFVEMGADPDVEAAQHLLAWIERSGVETFTKRDAYQGTKGRFKRVEALEPALATLVEHGYIRERPTEERRGPGRKPSPIYEVNPAVLRGNSGNCGNCGNTTWRSESSGWQTEEGEGDGADSEGWGSPPVVVDTDTRKPNGEGGGLASSLDDATPPGPNQTDETHSHNSHYSQNSPRCYCGAPAVGLDAQGQPWCRTHWWRAAPGSALPEQEV